MKNTLSKFLVFAFGAVVGSVVTWKVLDTKYKKIMDEEAESFRRAISERYSDEEECEEEIDENQMTIDDYDGDDLVDFREYTKIVKNESYTNYSDIGKGSSESNESKPYVITPEEFADIDEYDTETLFYHKDKILADTNGNLIEDVEGTVGHESLTTFGKYEDDSVFVRNDRLKTDFEVLLDERRYSDLNGEE